MSFLVSGILYVAAACPQYSKVLEFTWISTAQVQLHILGFATMILLGSIHEILPRVMGAELPFKKIVQVQFFCSMIGTVILVVSLVLAGMKQGHANFDPAAGKICLQISTVGLLLWLMGSLLLLINLLVMTLKWKVALVKTVITAINAPIESTEVKS